MPGKHLTPFECHAILNSWEASGGDLDLVAVRHGHSKRSIRDFVIRARKAGDARAVASNRGRGVAVGSDTREHALDAWCSEPFAVAPVIAEDLGITVGALQTIVCRARKAGDPRAVSRPRGRRKDEALATLYVRLRDTGLTVEEIARCAGKPVYSVKATFAVYDQRAA